MPVTLHSAPKHAPIPLVENGQTTAAIVLRSSGPNLNPMVNELREVFRLTTGAELPVITAKEAESHAGVLINIGNWPGAAAEGLVGSEMPVEGFVIKTAANQVFIVGHDDSNVEGVTNVASSGTAWGVSEFMERYLGVRWYWTTELDGRSIIERDTIVMEPVHLSDAPVFRKRVYFPPFSPIKDYGQQNFGNLLRSLRGGSSWPVQLAVHTPRTWHKNEDYVKNRPEIFQKNADGSRTWEMLDYAHPMTLQTYLEEIADYVENGTRKDFIRGNTVTVSPADFAVNSHSEEARALWDGDAGRYGQASRIMADFVQRLGEAMLDQFPDMHVMYLPYMNYTLAPDGYKFPGNVYVELCGMPGLAQYKEPSIREYEQANIDKWIEISGHPITDWHYSCWPADRTEAPFEYPYTIQRFYQENRGKTMGTFINGDNHSEWLKFNVSLYVWMKVLWNPDYDVDAGLDAFADRMFGDASDQVREIIQMQIDGWEESRWPGGVLTAQSIYEHSYPREALERFQKLFEESHRLVKDDELATRRLIYMEKAFDNFYTEFARVVDGEGVQEMAVLKVAENPVIDGKLDDDVWGYTEPVSLRVLRQGEQVEPRFPTTVRAVWTMDGVTFGFHMVEPDTDALSREVVTRDHALTWHDDCVELFIDVSGENQGEFAQFIINANGMVQDLFSGDETYDAEGIQVGVHKEDDFWSMEVFIPYKDLNYVKDTTGGDRWGIQLTRHRTGSKAKGTPGFENQKLNAGSGGFNSNLSDFSYLNFRE